MLQWDAKSLRPPSPSRAMMSNYFRLELFLEVTVRASRNAPPHLLLPDDKSKFTSQASQTLRTLDGPMRLVLPGVIHSNLRPSRRPIFLTSSRRSTPTSQASPAPSCSQLNTSFQRPQQPKKKADVTLALQMGHTLQQAIRRGANPPGLQGDDDLGCYLRIDRTRGPALSHCSSTRRAPHRLHQGVRGAPSDNLRARRLYFGTTTSHFPASRVHFPYKNDSRRSEGKRDKRDDRGRVRRGDDDRYRGSKRDQTEKRDRHRDESRHRNDDRDRSRHRKDSPCPDKERGHSSSRRDDDRRGDRRDNSRRCDRDRNRDDRRDDYKERDKQVHWEKKCAAIEREEDSELDGYFSDDWLQSQAAYYTVMRKATPPATSAKFTCSAWVHDNPSMLAALLGNGWLHPHRINIINREAPSLYGAWRLPYPIRSLADSQRDTPGQRRPSCHDSRRRNPSDFCYVEGSSWQ